MSILTPAQISNYAYVAGVQNQQQNTIATAIALAESSGNTMARHLNTNGTWDTGLWQINSVHSQFSQTQLYDPAYNAMAMFQISGGRNWGAWSTYTNGAYRQYLGVAQNGWVARAASGTEKGTPTPTPTPTTTPGSPSAFTVDQVFSSKSLWKWYSSQVTNPFDGIYEKGEDFSAGWGTPIGIVMGGIVVRSVHNNNSIGDVVEIQSGDGSVWLYQHIRTRVTPGQGVSTGDVVGIEDGLPRDQYSTGPHIEVRYCPPGRWTIGTDSWNEPWVNPSGIFSRAGLLPATGPNVSLGNVFGTLGGFGFGTGGTTFGPPKTYTPLLDQVHETLIATPGFYGIALALDEAEQFPGFIDLTQSERVDIPIGAFGLEAADISLPIPDVTGGVRSIGATITDNFMPAAIRGGLVLLGVFMFVMLFAKAISGPVAEILPEAMEAFG